MKKILLLSIFFFSVVTSANNAPLVCSQTRSIAEFDQDIVYQNNRIILSVSFIKIKDISDVKKLEKDFDHRQSIQARKYPYMSFSMSSPIDQKELPAYLVIYSYNIKNPFLSSLYPQKVAFSGQLLTKIPYINQTTQNGPQYQMSYMTRLAVGKAKRSDEFNFSALIKPINPKTGKAYTRKEFDAVKIWAPSTKDRYQFDLSLALKSAPIKAN